MLLKTPLYLRIVTLFYTEDLLSVLLFSLMKSTESFTELLLFNQIHNLNRP